MQGPTKKNSTPQFGLQLGPRVFPVIPCENFLASMTYLYTLGGQGRPSLQASQGLSEDITPPGCIASYLGREMIKEIMSTNTHQHFLSLGITIWYTIQFMWRDLDFLLSSNDPSQMTSNDHNNRFCLGGCFVIWAASSRPKDGRWILSLV